MNNKINIYLQHLKNAIHDNNMKNIKKYITKLQVGAGPLFSKVSSKNSESETHFAERFNDELSFINTPKIYSAYFGFKVDWSYDIKPLLYMIICIDFKTYYMPLMFIEDTTNLTEIQNYFKIQECQFTYSVLYSVESFNIKLSNGTYITDIIKSFNIINKDLILFNKLDDFTLLSRKKKEFIKNINNKIKHLATNFVDINDSDAVVYYINNFGINISIFYNKVQNDLQNYNLIKLKIREELSRLHREQVILFNQRIEYDNKNKKKESVNYEYTIDDVDKYYNMQKYNNLQLIRHTTEFDCRFKFITSYSDNPYNPFFSLVLDLPNMDWFYHTKLAFACHKYFNNEYHISLFTEINRLKQLIQNLDIYEQFIQLFNTYNGFIIFKINNISRGQSLMLNSSNGDIHDIKNICTYLNRDLHISMFNYTDIH